jgi:hypothetical protein
MKPNGREITGAFIIVGDEQGRVDRAAELKVGGPTESGVRFDIENTPDRYIAYASDNPSTRVRPLGGPPYSLHEATPRTGLAASSPRQSEATSAVKLGPFVSN